MPLFGRCDGDLVRGEPPVRRIMPFLMRGRNESAVLHEVRWDVSRARAWLETWNAGRTTRATLFHLLLFAIARTLHERKGLNRFVSGRRLYQRRGVQLSFAAKKAFADDAPILTVKIDVPENESFGSFVDRVSGSVSGARGGTLDKGASRVESELKLALLLPVFLLRVVFWFLRWLDSVNLLPAGMIKPDPMYTSAFVANLGSLGLDDTFHHLYEYGTASLFAAIGRAGPTLVLDDNGQPTTRDLVKVCWTFDERIHDGFYCARSIDRAREIIEDPTRFVTP
jgi:hypothetical protein